MENKRTPLKRPLNEPSDANRSSKKPAPNIVAGYRKLRILLPNGRTVLVKLSATIEGIYVKELVEKAKEQYDRDVESKKLSPRRGVNWEYEGVFFVDDYDTELRNKVKLIKLTLGRVYNLRLDDGSKPADIYENMWDLTPDTELLMELPEEYTFETALADLIDNSLQAVWSNDQSDTRLISVEVSDEKISIVDTGPGMDDSSIEKWGKMGASLHRAHKTQAVGGKPPYLKPAFGMFGYGGSIASMHLGRHTEVSSKTKNSKKVYMLRLERDVLVGGSSSKQTWRTSGSVRDPSGDELELSQGGSFTKVDIYEPMKKNIDIKRLQCKLKDIYFPYIQCDDLSKGKTITPIEFQVNGDDLAEILGGEVVTTNMHSCNGPEFVLQLHFTATSSPGSRSSQEANARLRCVYLPAKEGKETIETILETLKDGLGSKEEVGNFSHVSCRRLGRLLPDARWDWIPFMDFRQRKGEKSQILKRICMRVKAFIETDAGFNPTPSKTDFAHQNPYTNALRNLGSNKPPSGKEIGVRVDIRRDGKSLTPVQLDKQYRQWLLDMHDQYDEEADADCGTDDPVITIINDTQKKELHISSNVVRIHKSVRWKGKSWVSGQRIKILKGACAGFHNNNVYATLEYILLEGFQGDTGGEAWIICRAIDVSEENGSVLDFADGNTNFDLRKSKSLPMNVIKSGKCVAVDDSEWSDQLDKQNQKVPSSIEMLTSKQCCELGIESLPEGPEFPACDLSSCEVVAVVRPANYKSRTPTESLEQKFVMKDNFDMSLAITYSKPKKSQVENIYSGRVKPSSRKNLNGLYVFRPKCKSHPLFREAGVYTFTFSIRDSSCEKCVVKVRVKASSEVDRWALNKKISHHNLRVGCPCEPISVSMFDKFDNQLPFLEVPKLVIKIKNKNGTRDIIQIKQWNPSTSLDGSALIIEDLLIESFTLDDLRPSYDATMMLSLQDGSHLLDIPVKVLPGPIKRFTVQPENFEKQLIPGQVIKELSLEFFDERGNHVQENEKVEISMKGFGWVGRSTSNKVDASGCVNLGFLLKVSGGYGSNVSLSVSSSANRVVSTKEWQIDKRKLRAASLIPESCVAGSQLENIAFEVVNSKGDVDVHFHDEDNIGQSHTLVIKSQLMDIDESVKYVFREGRCVVRAVPVPHEEGEFSFVVAHSRYPELHLTIKVLVELAPEMEPLDTIHLSANDDILQPMDYGSVQHHTPDTQIDYGSVQHHTPERNTSCLPDRNTSPLLNISYTPESYLNFQQDLETELVQFKLKMAEHEENIKLLEDQIRAIESSLSKLDVARDQTLSTYGSPGKNEIISRVESMTDSAAGLVMNLFREGPEQDHHGLLGNIIGVVALLGAAPSELSRLFAEYLGDQMLAVVCKSYRDISLFDTYEKSGKLIREQVLDIFPAELRESINGRYHVLCLENISPCKAETDPQGKILLPDPTLPDGSTPIGFKGYAVNLIEVDADHVDTKIGCGYGLRETLFYRLFGETQVYESKEDLKNAIHCIKDGAVSLDGGIIRGNGAVYLGCLEPDIIFPVIAPKKVNSQQAMQAMKRRELKLKLKTTKEELNEEKRLLEIARKKFTKRQNRYKKYCSQGTPISCSQVSPIPCVEDRPITTDFQYISGTPSFDLSADASQNPFA